GVRALAQIPQHTFGADQEGIVVNFYDSAEGHLILTSGAEVKLELRGDYPFSGNIDLKIQIQGVARFPVRMRLPGWCGDWNLSVNGDVQEIRPNKQGYLVIQRAWNSDDVITLDLEMAARMIVDDLGNNGYAACVRGPLVYAADSAYLPEGRTLEDVVLLLGNSDVAKNFRLVKDEQGGAIHLRTPTAIFNSKKGIGWWRERERYYAFENSNHIEVSGEIELVPFYQAGNQDKDIYFSGVWPHDERVSRYTYQVWLPYIFRE
ncbi:MAG: hypothetical protein AB1649_30605, partial [Chloroflexota bacterium]